MKKLSYLLALSVAASTAFTSCQDVLEPETQSSFDESVVFSNETLAEYSIFSISSSFGETNNYRGRFLPWYGFNTDIEWYNAWKEGDDAEANVESPRYSISTSNKNLNLNNGPYVKMYEAIESANTCILGIRKYGGSAAEMKYLLGEALTLRALIYNDLIKAFGDVPARFEPVSSETMYMPKSSRDVIYKQILTDLEEAFDYLPWPGKTDKTSQVTRINKAYAKGLYARIALAASGYALRPDDGCVGTGNIGSVRLSSDPELQKSVLYPRALAACEDVIKNGGCKLYSDYEQLWKEQNQYVTDFKGEVLYVIPFSDKRGRWNYTFAVRHANGASGDQYSKMSGGNAGPVPTHFFDYDDADVRRDISCVNFRWSENSKAVQELAGLNTWYFGKYRFEWMNLVPSGNDDGVKPVYMRYSDILLMAAECANYLDDLSTAQTYFKAVRLRAFNGDETKAMANVDISSKDALFDAIVDERGLEFVGEFLRKGDLIRWNLLKTKMDEAKAKMNALCLLGSCSSTSYSSGARTKDYSYLSGHVYFKYEDDGETIDIYGLNHGETETPSAEWSESLNSDGAVTTYIKESAIKEGKINSMYAVDPDTRQFWPIFDTNRTDSQGSLVNDYGYQN